LQLKSNVLCNIMWHDTFLALMLYIISRIAASKW